MLLTFVLQLQLTTYFSEEQLKNVFVCLLFDEQDEEEQTYKQDFARPTLEDHFDKTVLPKVMQVENAI